MDWDELQKNIAAYRRDTFRIASKKRIQTIEDAISFVNERGYVFFWPCAGSLFPSLWTAVAGDRPVADAHDDPGHITWGWKDEALGRKYWYYARLLRRRNTMVSLEFAPYFYALSPNYGDPQEDYLEQYRKGALTAEAKIIYETLLNFGPMDTLELRRKARISSQGSHARFSKALDDLMGEMKVLPIGVSQSGGWRYAFIYDLVTRQYPDLADTARDITENQARERLLMQYFLNMGGADLVEACRLFRWQPAEAAAIAESLQKSHRLIHVTKGDPSSMFLVIPDIIL